MATTIYEAIRSSLIALLKGCWPAFDVFGEGIDKTQEAGRAELEDYIYLDIIPSGNQPAGRGYTDRSILVDAALHTKGESNLEYLQISQELDDLLRPVFRFTDKGEARAVTIPDLAFNIVDKVLHATFTLAFRDSIEEPEAPPLMAELQRLNTLICLQSGPTRWPTRWDRSGGIMVRFISVFRIIPHRLNGHQTQLPACGQAHPIPQRNGQPGASLWAHMTLIVRERR